MKTSEIHDFPHNPRVRGRFPGTTTPGATQSSEPDEDLLRLQDGQQVEAEGRQEMMEPRFKTRNVIGFFNGTSRQASTINTMLRQTDKETDK